jgi:ribosome-associated toxin RatA of RatAB toxin-antitoxin module
MLRLLFCLLIGCAGLALAAPSGTPSDTQLSNPTLEVVVTRVKHDDNTFYEVDASATVQAPLTSVWKILTDYERMSEFVPDLTSVRIVSRIGNQVVIEQFGNARFLFLSRPIHLLVNVTETPMSVIDIALLSGDMHHYEAHWKLVPSSDGLRIVYRGQLAPNFYVPALFGVAMVRGDIRRMMQAVLARLDNGRE